MDIMHMAFARNLQHHIQQEHSPTVGWRQTMLSKGKCTDRFGSLTFAGCGRAWSRGTATEARSVAMENVATFSVE
eukprot:213420-Pelagomonas_calceolata.AAC.5